MNAPITFDEQVCRQAYDDMYHKVRAEVGYDEWCRIWKMALQRTAPKCRTGEYADCGNDFGCAGCAEHPPSGQSAADPCPQCIPGGFCKTPTCGRLLAQPAAATPDEIEGLRAHVALLKSALAQSERENDELRRAQPAAATVPADEREAFEAWARNGFELHRHGGAEYSSHITQCAWAAWQARAALAAPAAPQTDLHKFYGVDSDADLIAAQQRHIEKLQARMPSTPSLTPQRPREG